MVRSNNSIIGVAILAATSLAQLNLSINERVFLTSSHSDAGIINVIEMFENNQDAADLRKFGDWT